jgi:hypothetical protein
MKNSTLTYKAMLVRLKISTWSGLKVDRPAAEEVNKLHNAAKDAGIYHKHLVSKEHLKAIKKIARTARQFHYENTLPWDDQGYRMLPSTNYWEYVGTMNKLMSEFHQEVDGFCKHFKVYKQEAQLTLGSLYDEDDYPDEVMLKELFDVSNHIEQITDPNDFRVSLKDTEVKKIKKTIRQQTYKKIYKANKNLWSRTLEVVQKYRDKLKDPDGKFKNTLVTNLKDVCEIVPRLNFLEDTMLDKLAEEASNELVKDPDDLRTNKRLRKDMVNKADEIYEKMKSYMPKNQEEDSNEKDTNSND